MRSKVLWRWLACACCVALTACAPLESLFAPTPTAAPRGVAIDPPKEMPEWTLTNSDGKSIKLSDFRGKAMLLFFGYTHCPDICPLSLADFRAIKKELGDTAKQLNFVMVSVDGERDTPEVMDRYVHTFDPEFYGITGNEVDVRKAGLNYGVHFEKQKPAGTAAAYLVAHTTYSYLLDSQGRWRMVFPFKTPAESVAADIKAVLASGQ
jgi:protein SCO1